MISPLTLFMKHDPTILINKTCGAAACLQCVHCSHINYEEARPGRREVKAAGTGLYAAEVQHYDFYFTDASENSSR